MLESNGGSIFEPPFTTRRRPPGRDSAGRRPHFPRPRLCGGWHARHRRRRRPFARQSVSLLQGQGRTAVFLPAPHARPAAGVTPRRAPRRRPARGTAPRARLSPCPLSGRRHAGFCRAFRAGCAAEAAARGSRRQTRSVRARRARARRRRHSHGCATGSRRGACDTRAPGSAELDRPLVPSGRTRHAAARGRRRVGLCRRRALPSPDSCT